MSIASEISRLQQAKEDLATAIGNKGVTVSVSATLDDFADYVDSIQTGGITPTGKIAFYQNGVYNIANYEYVEISVPTHTPTLITKTIGSNGTYYASDDSADGYSSVTVSVSGGITCTISISDSGIAASNFSSGTTPSTFTASGFDDTNGIYVTYCKDAYTDGCIMWYDQVGAYVWATGDAFPTLYSCGEGTSSTSNYSESFQDTSFTATVVTLT